MNNQASSLIKVNFEHIFLFLFAIMKADCLIQASYHIFN